jgi:hypothetical protein
MVIPWTSERLTVTWWSLEQVKDYLFCLNCMHLFLHCSLSLLCFLLGSVSPYVKVCCPVQGEVLTLFWLSWLNGVPSVLTTVIRVVLKGSCSYSLSKVLNLLFVFSLVWLFFSFSSCSVVFLISYSSVINLVLSSSLMNLEEGKTTWFFLLSWCF